MTGAGRLSLTVTLALSLPVAAGAVDRTCPSATTLDALVTCIRGQMPGSGSGGFVVPNATQQADWRWVVRQMLQGSCDFVLPASLAGIMQIRTFTDSGNGKRYCLLMEVLDANNNGVVDRGWGTFIVDPNAVRELSHQAPHPIFDSTTENEAVGVFRDTNSRSYLMCGAHRNANSQTSSCQSSYQVADCAHNTGNMFQPTNEEMLAFYGSPSWNAIQWHGMAADTCSNVEAYLTHGMNLAPVAGDKILELKNNVLLYHPTWKVQVPGTGACSLDATTNVQGRLLNGVAVGSVCNTAATAYTGVFIHNEQDPGFRTAGDWVAAVNDTWPVGPPAPPPAPTGLAAAPGNAQVSLSWGASSGATGYNIKRGTTSGGPYTTIATGVTATSYTDITVANGTTYYYVVTALNANGESGNSNQASATPNAPTPPAAPTGLTATPGKRKVTLSWSASAGTASYKVKRSTTNGGPYSVIASGVTATSYTNTGLQSGTTYYYVVSALNAAGESPNSNQASATPR
jgi:hypothetical protein